MIRFSSSQGGLLMSTPSPVLRSVCKIMSQLSQIPKLQVAFYTGGNQLEWREVESGQLPIPRYRLRAALVENIIFVTGGWDDYDYNLSYSSILAWDPASESWQEAGDLIVGQTYHAVVAVPLAIIESECSAMLLT